MDLDVGFEFDIAIETKVPATACPLGHFFLVFSLSSKGKHLVGLGADVSDLMCCRQLELVVFLAAASQGCICLGWGVGGLDLDAGFELEIAIPTEVPGGCRQRHALWAIFFGF
jgi:hypothetical protein